MLWIRSMLNPDPVNEKAAICFYSLLLLKDFSTTLFRQMIPDEGFNFLNFKKVYINLRVSIRARILCFYWYTVLCHNNQELPLKVISMMTLPSPDSPDVPSRPLSSQCSIHRPIYTVHILSICIPIAPAVAWMEWACALLKIFFLNF